MPDVPFLGDSARAIRLVDTQPYVQIATYLKVHRDRVAQVERTLSYVDVAIFRADRDRARPVRRRVDGHRLPAVDRLHRRIQLVWRSEGDPRVPVQRPRRAGGETHEAAMIDWLGTVVRAAG